MGEFKAIILAAGLGTRLEDLTKNTPKCLMEIKGKSLLERQIDILKRLNIEDITIVVGSKGDCWTQENINKIKKICPKIIVNFDNLSTKNSYSLSLSLEKINTPCSILTIDGDIFFEEKILKEMINCEEKLIILSREMPNSFIGGNRIIQEENVVKKIEENIGGHKENSQKIFSGIVCIKKESFEQFKEECNKSIYYREDITHPLNIYCQKNKVHVISVESSVINVNTPKDLDLARDICEYEYNHSAKKILILGASGFLGMKLFNKLSKEFNVYGTYSNTKRKTDFFYLDITNKELLYSFIKRLNPQIIIHTSAITNADFCETNEEKAEKINVVGTKNVVDICRKEKIKLIFLSSDYVYDGEHPLYSEGSPAYPINFYGKTKLEGERMIKQNLENYLILRPSILYGFNDEEDKITFVRKVIDSLRKKEKISVDNIIKKYPLLIDDLSEIIKKFIEEDLEGEFNISTEKGYTRYEWAKEIAKIFNLDETLISPEISNNIAKKPRDVCYNLQKIKEKNIRLKELSEGLKIMKNQESCMFRMIYSCRADKKVLGIPVSIFRMDLGKQLAKENFVNSDIIMGIPASGIYGAMGYSEESKIKFQRGIIKQERSHRTLMYENPKTREDALRNKLIIIPELIKNKKITLLDETIASGKTMAFVVNQLKNFGAKEIHVRIPCPIMLFNCKNNILDKDSTLIATKYFSKGIFEKEKIEEELRKYFEVDSLKFLSYKGFLKCFNYSYNVKPCVECLMEGRDEDNKIE